MLFRAWVVHRHDETQIGPQRKRRGERQCLPRYWNENPDIVVDDDSIERAYVSGMPSPFGGLRVFESCTVVFLHAVEDLPVDASGVSAETLGPPICVRDP